MGKRERELWAWRLVALAAVAAVAMGVGQQSASRCVDIELLDTDSHSNGPEFIYRAFENGTVEQFRYDRREWAAVK